jgi:hypothetical protein
MCMLGSARGPASNGRPYVVVRRGRKEAGGEVATLGTHGLPPVWWSAARIRRGRSGPGSWPDADRLSIELCLLADDVGLVSRRVSLATVWKLRADDLAEQLLRHALAHADADGHESCMTSTELTVARLSTVLGRFEQPSTTSNGPA